MRQHVFGLGLLQVALTMLLATAADARPVYLAVQALGHRVGKRRWPCPVRWP